MEAVAAFMTPTPTPSNYADATPLPTPAPYVPPTAQPSATPPAPLATYRGQILFWTNREDQPGLWVMMPDGRTGASWARTVTCARSTTICEKREQFSPDGRYRVYATSDQSTSAQSLDPGERPEPSGLSTWQVPNLSQAVLRSGVVARRQPDRLREHGDGPATTSGRSSPTAKSAGTARPNNWEWDKHPSWSPDSRRIVFWTNREGTKQLYVMDRDGKNQHNISKVAWDEYDPIWVK